MLDHFHLPTPNGSAEVFYFEGTIAASGDVGWFTWQKPRGKSMIDILLVGVGGNGGNGAVGANSTAAGGGGGSSGGQTRVVMPLSLLPDQLFIQLPAQSQGTGARVAIYPNTTANNTLAFANGGSHGGNASGATAGTAGTAASAVTAANMPIGWMFAQVLAGQAGAAGGSTVVGGNVTLPTTGLLVTGGAGGAGLGGAGSVGNNGGAFAVAGAFPQHSGGQGGLTAGTPPSDGSGGYRPISGLIYSYGGTGGGASHGSATGQGLFGGNGGAGAPGCGGGGGGGAITGSVQGLGSRGGPAFCVITVW